MGNETIISEVEKILIPILKAKDLTLVDIDYKGLGSRSVLYVYIDGQGRSVTLKECEEVSGLLSLELDARYIIDHPYVLEVSSPGLDRVLKTDRELKWALGKKVKLYLEDGGEIMGRFKDFDNENFFIEVKKEKIEEVKRSKVRKIKLNEV